MAAASGLGNSRELLDSLLVSSQHTTYPIHPSIHPSIHPTHARTYARTPEPGLAHATAASVIFHIVILIKRVVLDGHRDTARLLQRDIALLSCYPPCAIGVIRRIKATAKRA